MSDSSRLFQPLAFSSGLEMKNRLALAPLTNMQSHPDGRLSDEEFNWLTMRAAGGFGLTMTCAAHVQKVGQGFRGQLGVYADEHLDGLARLAQGIRRHGSLAFVQLHHAGMRTPPELTGQAPVAPSSDEETGARALTDDEVSELVEDFVRAAARAQSAGFCGVELHGAHGYILTQFLSPMTNRRDGRYGGKLENRSRVIFEIIEGVRRTCGPAFGLGLRLSPEKFGLEMAEMRELTVELLGGDQLDFLDLSLLDAFKEPDEAAFQGRDLLSWFADKPRSRVRLGVAGRIMQPAAARRCIEAGADFVLIGRGAILHHDYPVRLRDDAAFSPVTLPVTEAYLRREGLSDPFIDYMRTWTGFVAA